MPPSGMTPVMLLRIAPMAWICAIMAGIALLKSAPCSCCAISLPFMGAYGAAAEIGA
jgi:hypothetical protein